jgi:uncharacterized membrane protein YgdD (TMEM256/DUF423 family)
MMIQKIKSRLAKIKASISIQTYKRPMIFLISIMVLFNIIILWIAAAIAYQIDGSFTSVLDALINGSLKWMLTPNAILVIDNPKTMVLAVIVLIIGLVLFSGTIIALTTNALKDYFQKKQSGGGKILLENHIAILNWNNKVPELVADLVHIETRKITVIVLAEIDKTYAEKAIALTVKRNHDSRFKIKNLNVLVKNGNPLNRDDLDDISIQNASSILVMSKDGDVTKTDTFYTSDLIAIKQVLALGQIDLPNIPPIIVEIKDLATKNKLLKLKSIVKTLENKEILPICFDRRLGQMIAQTIIDSRMEDLYLELFSFEGSEVYPISKMDIDLCLQQRSCAIPLSIHENQLFVLSKSCLTANQEGSYHLNPKPLKVKPLKERAKHIVYLIGENKKIPFILESFKLYESMHDRVFDFFHFQNNQIKEALTHINNQKGQVTIVLLSDENRSKEILDANVLEHLIFIQTNIKVQVKIIVELLDPKNDRLFKDFAIENTIISNKIISLLLSKLALFKETAPFYEDLLTISPYGDFKDSQALIIYRAKDCFKEIFPISFLSTKHLIESIYHAYSKSLIPIGYYRDNKLNLFEGNLDQQKEVLLEDTDDLIFFKF